MNTNDKSTVAVSMQPAVRLIGMYVRTNMAKAAADCGTIFQKFGPRMHEIATNGGGTCYGISYMVEGSHDDFDYWAALPVATDAPVPAGMAACEIPAGLYASLTFDSFAKIAAAFQQLYMQWLPAQTDYALRMDAPCYEFYHADSLHTGKGTVFMPVSKR